MKSDSGCKTIQGDLFGAPLPPIPPPPAAPILRAGVYRCPFECGDKRYPAPKWKTKEGADRHVASCSMRPDRVAARAHATAQRELNEKRRREQALAACARQLGDVVCFWYHIVTHPMHDKRGRKVRYEEIAQYRTGSGPIVTIDWRSSSGFSYGVAGCAAVVCDSQITADLETARAEAARMQAAHDQARANAALCR